MKKSAAFYAGTAQKIAASTGIVCVLMIVCGGARVRGEGPARSRLAAAIDGTQELRKNARDWELAAKVHKDLPTHSFATHADAKTYTEQRPWFRQYLLLLTNPSFPAAELTKQNWPLPEDAPSLRDLLADPNPEMRGLAAEALATLHDPGDVPRIAKLLGDTAESIPALDSYFIGLAQYIPPGETGGEGPDGLETERSWQPRRVSDYAVKALRLMTGRNFERQDFAKWWVRNQGSRERVWYWQERLNRELKTAIAEEQPDWRKPGADNNALHKQYVEKMKPRFAAIRDAAAVELAQLPVEVEAKVRLFAVNETSPGSSAFDEPYLGFELSQPIMGRFKCPRVSSERLLELLERKDLWEDVDWTQGASYNLLAVQLGGQAELFFTRKDVERLRATLAREQRHLWWDGQGNLVVGISRLLPPAQPGKLDDPDTEDGALREGVRTLADVFAREVVVREIVRIGLPRNQEFLADQFFGEDKVSGNPVPDMRGSLLQSLASPPLMPLKRQFLATLLLDKRFEPLWRESNVVSGAPHRENAIRAVNTYAGKEIITYELNQRLNEPARADEALVAVQEIVRQELIDPPRKLEGE